MRQRDLKFTFSVTSSPLEFEVVQFELEEALCKPFRLAVELASHRSHLDFAQVLDQPALLTIWQGGTAVRHVHGLISSFTQGATGFVRTRYRAVIEPQQARLQLSSDWRIYQNKSVPEILQGVFAEHGMLHYQQNIHAEHQPREYCVQAGDTDFYFLERLAREEGLVSWYTFDEQTHLLHHSDKLYVQSRIPGGPVKFNAQPAAESPLSSMRCFANPATSVTAYAAAKEASMSNAAYQAPTTSPRLETLGVLSIGISLDVFRQGQLWQVLQQQSAAQTEALHVGSILPMDPKKYPFTADDKDMAYEKRQADALELGLKNFLEKWPIPTVTVVRGWSPNTPNLRFTPERTKRSLSIKVNDLRMPAGLHWHRITNLQDGVICDDTPEGVLEALFLLFERNPDLPAVLVYANEGINMAWSLSSRDVPAKSFGGGTGPRVPGALTDSMVALIVGRPERVNWLRYYAPYTKANKNPIDPEFTGWGWRKPPVEFQPSTFIPQPWTERALEQWDALPVLAKLHRPITVSLTRPDTGERLKREALNPQLASGWKQATASLTPQPARLFYDGGLNATPLAELVPALNVAHSSLDLLDSKESYDLTQRLGDTGAASPFVGIALATMASYLNGDTSVVMPLRRKDQATIIAVTSPTPGKKPANNPFGVSLMSQNATSDAPKQPTASVSTPPSRLTTQQPLGQDFALEQFLADMKPKADWMDEL